jgi:hypothetical protein
MEAEQQRERRKPRRSRADREAQVGDETTRWRSSRRY